MRRVRTIRLEAIEPDLRARAAGIGTVKEGWLTIDAARLARLGDTEQFTVVEPVSFPGYSLRSELDQAAVLTICEPCDRNKGGRCSLCRSCGGGIPVADWVKMANHHCPEKKW